MALIVTDANFAETLNTDKPVLVDFWATWCGPCVKEVPKMKSLYSEFKAKGVEFIGISVDDPGKKGLASVKSFVEGKEVKWPQFHGEAAIEFARQWAVNVIPTIFVVDKQGQLHTIEGRGELESLIPELLLREG